MTKKWRCPICKKRFKRPNSVGNHARDAHGEVVAAERVDKTEDEDDRSLADIAVEAELKRAMGEPLDPLEDSLIFDD